MDETDFYWFHRFNTLVDRRIAAPLECELCSSRLHMQADGIEIILRCYLCDRTIKSGLKIIDRVKDTVKEYDRRRTGK